MAINRQSCLLRHRGAYGPHEFGCVLDLWPAQSAIVFVGFIWRRYVHVELDDSESTGRHLAGTRSIRLRRQCFVFGGIPAVMLDAYLALLLMHVALGHPLRRARLQQGCDALERVAGMAVGIDGNLVAILAAENLPYRKFELLADNIQHRRLDTADGVISQSRRGMNATCLHPPDEAIDGGWIFAHKNRVEFADDGRNSRAQERLPITGDLLVSFHFDENPIEIRLDDRGCNPGDFHEL